jgi:hypothetical protein
MASNKQSKPAGSSGRGGGSAPKPASKAQPKAHARPASRVAAKPAPKPSSGGSRLGAIIDGRALSDDEARVLWVEFSVHMDDHVGDLAGFARSKGWTKIVPEHRAGRAVLVISTK